MPFTPVKAIVVHSPDAQEIAAGTKTTEWRCWRTRYRGWLAIVAARRRESGADAGRAVCLLRLVDCVMTGPKYYDWLLVDPIPLAARVEVPGRLGLFAVTDLLAPHVPTAAAPPPMPTPRRAPVREIHQFLGRSPKGWVGDDPPPPPLTY